MLCTIIWTGLCTIIRIGLCTVCTGLLEPPVLLLKLVLVLFALFYWNWFVLVFELVLGIDFSLHVAILKMNFLEHASLVAALTCESKLAKCTFSNDKKYP
jgi:hypothetical protein